MLDVTPYVCGGFAAVSAEIATFPVDTAKVRLQLQGQTKDHRWSKMRYTGTIHCLACITKEEGIRAVYKGLAPALIRQAVYGTIKFGLYYSIKEVLSKQSKKSKESNLTNLACAVFAGSVSSAIATPTDVLKVRMQARATDGKTGLLRVILDILSKEGFTGLWKGVVPTAQRAALVAGVQLPVYDWTKYQLAGHSLALMNDGLACHFLSSMFAGFSAALVSSPVDVVRTRLMVQAKYSTSNHGNTIAYRSALHCACHTFKSEGFPALFKGFFPSFARMGPWNVIFFVVYEKLKALTKQ